MKGFCRYFAIYFMFCLACHEVFVSKKKKQVHIAFKIPISEYESFDRLVGFISNKWEKIRIFFEDYKMIYPYLISSLKLKFDYIFFERETKNGK